ncbi:methyltransferase family protein [Gracilimonas tropica]|uniref:methyltransferase family protein n=1 Tax=Gracilimonas tropica TaxID=454600 RepID=UPI0003783DC9|nr:isoprenylcysteine carboxylmethyltransferase family protein [Gracilimonas tropica]
MKLKVPPALLFIVFVLIMRVTDQLFSFEIIASPYQQMVAYIVFGVGVIIGLLGVFEFRRRSTTVNPHKPENTSELVTSGIYQISRNPMYLGLLIGLVAVAIRLGNVSSMLLLPVFVWYMNVFQIKPEEEVMEEKFGQNFIRYMNCTRRWI